jgi:hypothetical protein
MARRTRKHKRRKNRQNVTDTLFRMENTADSEATSSPFPALARAAGDSFAASDVSLQRDADAAKWVAVKRHML